MVAMPYAPVALAMSDPLDPRRTFDHALALGLGFAWAGFSGQTRPLVIAAVWMFGTWIWSARGRWTPSGSFGAANFVTAIRLGLAFSMLALPLHLRRPGAGLLLMAFFALDGLDGKLARRSGQSSKFGAAFDMETDAFMTGLASIVAVDLGCMGLWMLVVGGLRYVFVLVTHKFPCEPEPVRTSARWAFSLLMVGLTAALTLDWPPFDWLATAGALGVVASFGRSFVWVFQHRRGTSRV